MSKWNERVEKHKVHTSIENLFALIDNIKSIKNLDLSIFEELERIREVTKK